MQLLDVSRIDSGRLQVTPEWTDRAVLMCATVNGLPRSADDQTISVQAERAVDAVVYSVRMEQELVNLWRMLGSSARPLRPLR